MRQRPRMQLQRGAGSRELTTKKYKADNKKNIYNGKSDIDAPIKGPFIIAPSRDESRGRDDGDFNSALSELQETNIENEITIQHLREQLLHLSLEREAERNMSDELKKCMADEKKKCEDLIRREREGFVDASRNQQKEIDKWARRARELQEKCNRAGNRAGSNVDLSENIKVLVSSLDDAKKTEEYYERKLMDLKAEKEEEHQNLMQDVEKANLDLKEAHNVCSTLKQEIDMLRHALDELSSMKGQDEGTAQLPLWLDASHPAGLKDTKASHYEESGAKLGDFTRPSLHSDSLESFENFQKDLLTLMMDDPGMVHSLSANLGPCNICHNQSHPSLRCPMLTEEHLEDDIKTRMEELKNELEIQKQQRRQQKDIERKQQKSSIGQTPSDDGSLLEQNEVAEELASDSEENAAPSRSRLEINATAQATKRVPFAKSAPINAIVGRDLPNPGNCSDVAKKSNDPKGWDFTKKRQDPEGWDFTANGKCTKENVERGHWRKCLVISPKENAE